MDEAEDLIEKEEPIFKALYVDKLYLDKYEQNNNFAQIGIKELSGALNIGATYGKEAIPKKITEQVKEDMEKMKEMKEEMENSQPHTDKPDDIQHDGSSSEQPPTQLGRTFRIRILLLKMTTLPLERILLMINRASEPQKPYFGSL